MEVQQLLATWFEHDAERIAAKAEAALGRVHAAVEQSGLRVRGIDVIVQSRPQPGRSLVTLLFAIQGLRTLGFAETALERAFSTWLAVHHPELLSPMRLERLAALRRIELQSPSASKQEFLKGFLRAGAGA
jgi:hypothetical protein